MAITPDMLTEALDRAYVLRHANAANAKLRAAAKQRITYRNDGKRAATSPWSHTNNADGEPGTVGMGRYVHVCSNLKTARLKPAPIQRWHPPVAPEAYAIEPYETKNGETRYRPREMGTGAYDPRVRHGLNGVRRVVAAIRTRVVIIGGVEVTIG